MSRIISFVISKNQWRFMLNRASSVNSKYNPDIKLSTIPTDNNIFVQIISKDKFKLKKIPKFSEEEPEEL